MMDVPLATRWTLYALGAIDGQRVRRPRDPVAAWLLRRLPGLLPPTANPSVLTMIRARASVVDRMIEEEVARARRQQLELGYWGFGVGFDARWYRLMALMGDVVRSHREIDEPAILGLKTELLDESTFARAWSRVERRALGSGDWDLAPETSRTPLVVLEGVASRLSVEGLRRLLWKIRESTPGARVVVDIPGVFEDRPGEPQSLLGPGRARWGSIHDSRAFSVMISDLRRMGYRLLEEVCLSARPDLRGPSGSVICSGMEALRILRLAADAPREMSSLQPAPVLAARA
jgi:O-methyltransferase involved in polyketide biosynthesis